MPEITAVHFAIFALLFTAGAAIGWIMRGDRSARERIAVNAGWQERVEAQDQEQLRLAEQNRDLMQSVSKHQAAQKDTAQRAKELSQALKDAVARRDELQRQLKDIRSDLERAIRQRDRFQADIRGREARGEATVHVLREKDNKIFRLSRELTSWQNRLPPLIEKFHDRDREAKVLASRLQQAERQLAELESRRSDPGTGDNDTRIEPAGPGILTDDLDASNDQYGESLDIDLSDLQDQIVDEQMVDEEDPRVVHEPVPTVDDTAQYASYADAFPRQASQPVNNHSPESPTRRGNDDLQLIRGVGPAIERTLHDLGIFSFDQIAKISESDINRVAERLRGFRSRIYREDWIGQARSLHDLRHTEPV
jgi:predicted flap endonuclease-1-like 5' DNA nuclease